MTPHERALLAIYDLIELDRARGDLEQAWIDFQIARLEVDFL